MYPKGTGAMASVEVKEISKQYGAVVAVHSTSFGIESGKFVALLGPSGSGKTTLLNVISGMVTPDRGSVLIDGEDVTNLPPQRRELGMVFQNYALIPHMSVFDNVAFPLKVRGIPRVDIKKRVMEALDLVQLGSFAGRRPKELSGGQQQRVAIARCLVYKPRLILMDEPLGALDKKLREQLQYEIKKIQTELRVTVLYVTHDQTEALTMSDSICVMKDGRIAQIGTPDELYFRPSTEFIASFIGDSNLIPVTIDDIAGNEATVRTIFGVHLRSPTNGKPKVGQTAKLLIRPECVTVTAANSNPSPKFPGTIHNCVFNGQSMRYLINLSNGATIAARINSHAAAPKFSIGDSVNLTWAPQDSFVVVVE
jgi:putative spermidine/putrescine transport system ATP-binding protein